MFHLPKWKKRNHFANNLENEVGCLAELVEAQKPLHNHPAFDKLRLTGLFSMFTFNFFTSLSFRAKNHPFGA